MGSAGPGPPPLGPSEFQKAGCGKERPVVRESGRCVLALQPRVVEQPLDLRQPQPVGCLPEQPGRDPAAAIRFGDAEVADVGPSARCADSRSPSSRISTSM